MEMKFPEKRTVRGPILPAVILTLAACTSAAASAPAATSGTPADAARCVPEDSILYLEVPSIDALIGNFRKTSAYGLYKEPAMRRFIGPIEEKIRQKIDEGLRKMWKELGVEDAPKELPWPRGRMVLALQMQERKVKMPDYDWDHETGEMTLKGYTERTVSTPVPLLLADMGENMPKLKAFVSKASAGATEKGFARKTATYRGVEITSMIPPKAESEDAAWAMRGTTFLFSAKQKLIEQVLARMMGEGRPGLAGSRDFQGVMRRLGRSSADVAFYLNIRELIARGLKEADEESRAETRAMLDKLGVSGITGLGAVAQVASKGNENLRVKAMLHVQGEKRGLIAALTPKTDTTTPHRMLTSDLAGFAVLHYDAGAVFDGVVNSLPQQQAQVVLMMLQQAMMATGDPDSGVEPVDVRKDVLAQLAGPVTVYSRLERPLTAQSMKFWLSIGVRNGSILDKAVARIHNALIARGNRQLQRELLDRTLYLLPPGGPFGPGGAALSVVGDMFVVGEVGVVEQCIRTAERGKARRITEDPMYRYAARYLPAQAGAYFYGNDQASAEMLWTLLKKQADQPADEAGPRGTSQPGLPPIRMLLPPELWEIIDFGRLPEFSAVKKYFGPSVGYVAGEDSGIYMEMISLKAPAPAAPATSSAPPSE
jgi:hypothetical protein